MISNLSEMKTILTTLPIHIQKDINFFLSKTKLQEDDSLVYKLYSDNYNKPLLLLCHLSNNRIDVLKNILVYGFFGEYASDYEEKNLLIMELSVKLSCKGTPIEIIKLHAGLRKRTGRGTLSIKFLEEELIGHINHILKNHSDNTDISYIFGISSDLSDDTNALSRAKFYCRNGFTMSNSHFYKYLKE